MKNVIAFVLGAAAGSVVTWKLIEKKYKDLADEEIASVVERFKDRKSEVVKKNSMELIDNSVNEAEVKEFKTTVEKLGYFVSEDGVTVDKYTVEQESVEEGVAPYLIEPMEYANLDDYDTKSWTLTSDFVLIDESGDVIDDPESIVGDALVRFGEYDDDSVYVRNENMKCDFEILKVEKTFDEYNK